MRPAAKFSRLILNQVRPAKSRVVPKPVRQSRDVVRSGLQREPRIKVSPSRSNAPKTSGKLCQVVSRHRHMQKSRPEWFLGQVTSRARENSRDESTEDSKELVESHSVPAWLSLTSPSHTLGRSKPSKKALTSTCGRTATALCFLPQVLCSLAVASALPTKSHSGSWSREACRVNQLRGHWQVPYGSTLLGALVF